MNTYSQQLEFALQCLKDQNIHFFQNFIKNNINLLKESNKNNDKLHEVLTNIYNRVHHLASIGYKYAQLYLAQCFEFGYGVSPSKKAAFK